MRLATLRAEWDVRLVGAHLNHGFRGAEAEGDAEYVRALCDGLGIPCYCESVDVPALRKRAASLGAGGGAGGAARLSAAGCGGGRRDAHRARA